MVKVESLQYDVIFKKAFRNVDLFTGLVKDFAGVQLEIEEVENDKVFFPSVGNVEIKFDLFAEDKKNRLIVEAQHASRSDNFDRFLYYHCTAMVETIPSSKNYHFPITVITLVFFTHRKSPSPDNNILVQDFEMKNFKDGQVVNHVYGRYHRIIFVFTNDPLSDLDIPESCREWIEAIDDSLDEKVDEEDYDNPLIKRLFQVISKEQTTPAERARMKEEYNQQLAEMEAFKKGQKQAQTEKLREVAGNLKALGTVSDEQIARVTGLTLKEVRSL